MGGCVPAAGGAAGRHLHPSYLSEVLELCTGMLLAVLRATDRAALTSAAERIGQVRG